MWCGQRERTEKHLDKVKALKVATFVSFTLVNPKNASSLFFYFMLSSFSLNINYSENALSSSFVNINQSCK